MTAADEPWNVYERLFDMTNTIEEIGIQNFLRKGFLQSLGVEECLRAARRSSVGSSVASLIGDQVRDSFLSLNVVAFESSAREGGDTCIALHRLSNEFVDAVSFLRLCAELLDSPTLVPSFGVAVRCALLKGNYIRGDEPAGKAALLQHLTDFGRGLLDRLQTDGFSQVALLQRERTLLALHALGLARSVEVLGQWKAVLHEAIENKIAELDDDESGGAVESIPKYNAWKDAVLSVFVRVVFGLDSAAFSNSAATCTASELRAEVDQWCQELEQRLLTSFARNRIDHFWDLVVEYPASIAALKDLRYCLSRSNGRELMKDLIDHAKKSLASRLHRAGTCTENILVALVSAIRALCVVLSKHEQSSGVLAVVGDTLRHLAQRKDSVSAVVSDITQKDNENSILRSDLAQHVSSVAGGRDDDDSDNEGGGAETDRGEGQGSNLGVLRVLLSTLSVQAIVDEFRHVLAQRLLTKEPHDYDTLGEEEVVERVKCVFGEDLLAASMVMIRDLQGSRRLNVRINAILHSSSTSVAVAGTSAPLSSSSSTSANNTTNAKKFSATIVSSTCWPKVQTTVQQVASEQIIPNLKFTPHPLFVNDMQRYAAAFRQLKPNQALVWMNDMGRVTLRLPQKDKETGVVDAVAHELSLFAASMVLYLKQGPLTIDALAQQLSASSSHVLQRAQQHHPVVFVVHPSQTTVSLQTNVVTAATFSFESDVAAGAASGGGAPASGFPPEEMTMITNTVLAMLKARAVSKTASEIHNSLKMFIKFSGSLQDLKKALQFLVSEGKLATTDGNTFSLPKPVASS